MLRICFVIKIMSNTLLYVKIALNRSIIKLVYFMAKGKNFLLSVEILPKSENIIRVVYSYGKEKNRNS
jgi:hypothetical protein